MMNQHSKLSRHQLAIGRERLAYLKALQDATPASQHVMFRSKPNEPCLLDTLWLPEAARCRELDELAVRVKFTMIENTWVGWIDGPVKIRGRLRAKIRRWLVRLIDG